MPVASSSSELIEGHEYSWNGRWGEGDDAVVVLRSLVHFLSRLFAQQVEVLFRCNLLVGAANGANNGFGRVLSSASLLEVLDGFMRVSVAG